MQSSTATSSSLASSTPVSSHIMFAALACVTVLALIGLYLVYRQQQAVTSSTTPLPSTAGVAGPSKVTSGSPSATTTAGDADKSRPTQSSSTSLPGLSRNGIGIGFIPDDGHKMKMADIMTGLDIKPSYYGWYAQLPGSGTWDGSQLLNVMDDVKKSGAIFQAAVMPTKGWAGLTEKDDSQAKAIADVLQKFTDNGIEVWLRFAHEINWYLRDGTYQGTKDDFKAAWSVISKAVKGNDKVKMYFSPNVADMKEYDEYFPDPSTVDVLGIDYYPKQGTDSFIAMTKPLHDKYCLNSDMLFAIAETGLMYEATIEQKLTWLDSMTNATAKKELPKLVGVTWFNYDKEQDFVLWASGATQVNTAMKEWISTNAEQ